MALWTSAAGPIEAAGTDGSEDGFVLKLSPNGTYVWANTFGDSSSDLVTSVRVGPDGHVYVTGAYNGSVGFGGNHASIPHWAASICSSRVTTPTGRTGGLVVGEPAQPNSAQTWPSTRRATSYLGAEFGAPMMFGAEELSGPPQPQCHGWLAECFEMGRRSSDAGLGSEHTFAEAIAVDGAGTIHGVFTFFDSSIPSFPTARFGVFRYSAAGTELAPRYLLDSIQDQARLAAAPMSNGLVILGSTVPMANLGGEPSGRSTGPTRASRQ